uniref:Secreted protein n=1 Tax=Ascaris lumbricoides TaxID=6252 RepID=A0A0M3HRA7_ASCLU
MTLKRVGNHIRSAAGCGAWWHSTDASHGDAVRQEEVLLGTAVAHAAYSIVVRSLQIHLLLIHFFDALLHPSMSLETPSTFVTCKVVNVTESALTADRQIGLLLIC